MLLHSLLSSKWVKDSFRVNNNIITMGLLWVGRSPVLQPYYNIPGMHADACLPRGNARREAMINAGAISLDA